MISGFLFFSLFKTMTEQSPIKSSPYEYSFSLSDFKNKKFKSESEKDDFIIEFLDKNFPIDLHIEQVSLFNELSEEGFIKWNEKCRYNVEKESRNKRLEYLKDKCWNGNMNACESCKFLMTHEESWHFKLAKNIRKAEQRGDNKRLAQLRSRVYPDHPL